VDGLQFDHGVQYFTARGLCFSALVEDWCVERKVGEWFDSGFVGTPTMTAPARAMADGLAVVGGPAVTALARGASSWTVINSAGVADAPGNGAFSTVVLAVPALQAVPIAATAGVAFPQLAAARYAPCWALMLAFEMPLSGDWDYLRPHDGRLAWVSRNVTKLGRSGGRETLVVHAGPDWSRRNLERTQEIVTALFEPHWRAAAGITAAPTFTAAHHWRYARVEETAGAPFLWDEAARLGACGDWCLGPRVEPAFDSGEAMVDAVIAGLAAR
jgi:predicted NAD/FAD-dependent oxidoreductase